MKQSPTRPLVMNGPSVLDDCLLTALEDIESGVLAVNRDGEVVVSTRRRK